MTYTNVTIDFLLWKWPADRFPDKRYPVKLRVTYKGERQYYGRQYGIAGIYTDQEFAAIQGNPRSPEYKREKAKLETIRSQVQRFIEEMGPFGFSFEKLSEAMGRTSDKDNPLLTEALTAYAGEQEKDTTATVYYSTRSAIERFDKSVTLLRLNIDYLERLENHLRGEGAADNTIAIYMSAIRRVYNRHKRGNSRLEKAYPFGRDNYALPRKKRTKKLTDLETLRKLVNLEPRHQKYRLARDIYVFSFFCGGANTADIYQLTRRSIRNNCLIFEREKTGIPAIIPIVPTLQEIIDRRAGDEYLLPVLVDQSKSRSKAIRSANATVNNHLRALTGTNIVVHAARGSFSTYANEIGMPLPMIRSLMAHSHFSITEGYMSMTENKKLEWLLKLENYVKQG